MSNLTGSDRWIIVIAALLFWLVVPFPFWLLGAGFAGQLVFWPSFEPDVALLSLLFVIAFYGPLLLIAAVAADALAANRQENPENKE